MDEERARALLGEERHRLELLLRSLDADRDRVAPADAGSEDLVLSGRPIPDHLDAARLGPSREPFQVLNDPAAQDNQLVEDDETTFDEPPPERDPAMPAVPDGTPEDDTGRILPSRRAAATASSEVSRSPMNERFPARSAAAR